VWAALIARVNAKLPASKRQRFLTPLLYRPGPGGKPLGSVVCKDISIGTDNASRPSPGRGYAVGTGYDAVTGWGVPDGKALLMSLSSKSPNSKPIGSKSLKSKRRNGGP